METVLKNSLSKKGHCELTVRKQLTMLYPVCISMLAILKKQKHSLTMNNGTSTSQV